MNLSVARSFRAALYLLLAIMLTLTTLVSGTSPASAAPENLPAAPADPIVEIEDRIPEAVPVTPIPVEVPTTVIEAGAESADSAVETEPTATPQPTEDELDEAWKSGFNAGFGEAKLTAHPPQPSEMIAAVERAFDEIRELNMSGRDENGRRWANSDLIDQTVTEGLVALRALKGGA